MRLQLRDAFPRFVALALGLLGALSHLYEEVAYGRSDAQAYMTIALVGALLAVLAKRLVILRRAAADADRVVHPDTPLGTLHTSGVISQALVASTTRWALAIV